jgi:hypothetical protein
LQDNQIMRRTVILTALLLSCSSVWADGVLGDHWRISILAAEISTEANEFAGQRLEEAHAGIGVGVAYAPTPQWDVEMTVASRTHRSPYTFFFYSPGPDGTPGQIFPGMEFREYRVMPVDVSVTRHFLADQPIAPYVRAGVRYVAAPDDPSPATAMSGGVRALDVFRIPVREGFGLDDRTSAQAGAGVRVRLTPRTALRAEATRLLRSKTSPFDPLTRYAIGVSWLF